MLYTFTNQSAKIEIQALNVFEAKEKLSSLFLAPQDFKLCNAKEEEHPIELKTLLNQNNLKA